jgi:hypothetical protein
MQGLLKRADLRWFYDQAFLPDKERADIGTRELPLELAFLAAEDISPELMEERVGATRSAVWSLERLLSEGKIIEEAYYRALDSSRL